MYICRLAKLHETGILLRLQTLYNLKLSPNLNQDTKSSEVSLNHVIGPFLILIAGVILSILLLIWELGYSKVKPHLKQQKFEYKT